MGGNRVTNGSGYSDLRLTIKREGNKIVSVLSFYDLTQGNLNVCYESNPAWDIVEAGIDILQNPEDHSDASITPLGEELGRAAFGSQILSTLAAHLQSKRVRLWIRASGDLSSLPWEACSFSDPTGPVSGILSLHPGLSIIRDAGGIAFQPREKTRRTRVLVIWADPSSPRYPHLPGIEPEVRSIMRSLATPECRRFEVEQLQFASRSSLERSVGAFRPDIVHFVGHGDLLPTGGVLILESGQPNIEAQIHGDELAKILSKSKVQVVVLSGCMTGIGASGVAAELASMGIPAVIGMQAPLHEGAAGMFARAFYGSLGAGESVDEAVLEGRSAIRGSSNDWAVPVVIRTPFEAPTFEDDFDYDLLPEAPRRRHNLTYDERPFVGRNVERLNIRDRISIKRQRLVTITGMGGMGKTRLAKQVSAELLDDFPDGVWMVECDTFESRDQLVGGIASAIGVTELGADQEGAVIRDLASKKLLLFLDCFERIVDHAEFIDAILKHSSDAQVLVTSRIVLGLTREFEYRLSPMAFKKKGAEQVDSVSLFVEAAGHAVNYFEVTPKNRGQILELCKELEGVPLALVLAAGRLRHLSLTELLEQVKQHPLEVLRRRGGPKDRQSDLHRVVASSFLLLGKRECGLLDKLSLFVGGFCADDAAEVCGWSKTEMTHGLSTLRDHSLIQVQLVNDRTRFKLPDTVREFLEQLPRDDEEASAREGCARRHAERYARIAEDIGNLMAEGRLNEGTSLLWSEIGNLRSACHFCASGSLYDLTRKLAGGLVSSYYNAALNADFESLIGVGLESAYALSDIKFEARLLGLSGAYAASRKEEAGWRSAWGRRAEICQQIGDLHCATDALFDIAWECFSLGNVEEATELLDKATVLAIQAKHHQVLANCYVAKAQIEVKLQHFVQARKLISMAREESALCDDPSQTILLHQHLTLLYSNMDEPKLAREMCAKYLSLALPALRYRGVAWALLKLAEFHEADAQFDLAATCLLGAVRLQAEFASRQGEKSRALMSQFLKRHGEMAEAVSAKRKTSWRTLISQLPYMAGTTKSIA